MAEPVILPRPAHVISRRDIDPDALRVLYRLRQHNHTAYLVGGSVRDLLLQRRPKDFDIGTSAHPYQVKKLFRNCWIIGRRFRLAHIKFGPNTIEVATFRRQVPEPAEPELPVELTSQREDDGHEMPPHVWPRAEVEERHVTDDLDERGVRHDDGRERLIHRDNTFGTPEEDAFRRDFTINALFYDIDSFAVIDYVGGLNDLDARVVRSIGDPRMRFVEDPVRMLRAVVLAARLDFHLDEPVIEAIAEHRSEIGKASPARLLEEYYKILRSGVAEKTFRGLQEARLLEYLTPALQRAPDVLWRSLQRLDAYRAGFSSPPDTLTNATLIGTLLAPLGAAPRRHVPTPLETQDEPEQTAEGAEQRRRRPRAPRVTLGALPIARRDIERLRLMLALQYRLLDLHAPPRVQRAFVHRHGFHDALLWMEVHGERPDVVQYWRGLLEHAAGEPGEVDHRPRKRRRRRRRRPTGRMPNA